MNNASKIYVAGHTGMVGNAICKVLYDLGYINIITISSKELDLRRQKETEDFFKDKSPEYVFIAAATVGGIMANSTAKAQFYYDNAMIAQNIIHASWLTGVKKLINLGSSCIYPRDAKQPLKEEYLLTGPLESTNDAYAIAKISAVKMCQFYNEQYGTDFVSAMPTNLYGPYDNFDYNSSHVLPAMIRKFHDAKIHGKEIMLWGDGSPYREFLYSEDFAHAIIHLMISDTVFDIINVGVGDDITIMDLSELVAKVVGYDGTIQWDASKPNGTPRKLLNVSRINSLGWHARIYLEDGIRKTYEWFLKNEYPTECY